MTSKEQILETITAISKMILITFKSLDTKIAIRNHTLIFSEPMDNLHILTNHLPQSIDKFLGQSVDRFMNGDSREDIFLLNKVISRFILWYVLPYKEKENDVYKSLINMSKYLCFGLEKLQETYKTGNVVGNLQYYILVLLSVINETFIPETLLDNSSIEDEVAYSTMFDIDKFKDFWSKDELKSLIKQFDECFKNIDEPDNIIFEKTNKVAINEDKQLSSIATIFKIVPKKLSNVIVSNHICNITHILKIMDKKFIGMLNQSMKN
uniref:Uncharacterized protein n=1 Tax=viral metagenome TaxID=1070528 RepID=A0A6C0BDI3_9ZZZZ